MRKLKVPGRIIGKVYKLSVLKGQPCRTSLDTIYPMHYGEISNAFAKPTSDDPEFQPYADGDIDIDGRGRDGLPTKRDQEPNFKVMMRRILRWPKHTRINDEVN